MDAITEDAAWRQLVKQLKSLRLIMRWPLVQVSFLQAFHLCLHPVTTYVRKAYHSIADSILRAVSVVICGDLFEESIQQTLCQPC